MSGRGIEHALYAKLTPTGLYVMLAEHQTIKHDKNCELGDNFKDCSACKENERG